MTTMSQADKVKELESHLNTVKAGSLQFATELIGKFKKYKKLSDKQIFWVEKLTEDAKNPPVQKKVEVGNFAGVIALFQKAQSKLKYPKINLQCGGEKINLSIAGAASKAPGYVNVAGEGKYPNRKWFGRVSPLGQWMPASGAAQMEKELTELLQELASNPARTAKKYGKLTGHCCFCNLPLSDPKSTSAGFGPVCAKNYGLYDEWMSAVKKEQEKEAVLHESPTGEQIVVSHSESHQVVYPQPITVVHGPVLEVQPLTKEQLEELFEVGEPKPVEPLLLGESVFQPIVDKMKELSKVCFLCEQRPSITVRDGFGICEVCAKEIE